MTCNKSSFLCTEHLLPKGGIAVADFNTEYKYREILGDNTFCAVFENSAYIWANYLEPGVPVFAGWEIDFFAREKGQSFPSFPETHWQRCISWLKLGRRHGRRVSPGFVALVPLHSSLVSRRTSGSFLSSGGRQ